MHSRRLALCALPLTAFACFSSDDNSGPGNDAGYTVSDGGPYDGTIPDSGSPFADAIATDTSPPIDAPVDAAPLPVTITVVGPAGPESGVTIIFSDASGAMIGMGTTNSAGSYAEVVAAGSQVTALLGSSQAPLLVTVVGVEPGDMLTARDASNAELSMSIPALPANPPANAVDYVANPGHCQADFEGAPETYPLDPDCYGPSSVPLLVLAMDSNANPLGFTYEKAVPLDADAGTATASALGAWSTTIGTETVTLASTSGGTPNVFFNEYVGALGASGNNGFTVPTDGGTPSVAFPTHPGFADFVQAEINTVNTYDGNGDSTVLAIATRTAPPTPSGTVSLDPTQYLAPITLATLDSSNPARPTVNITASASLSSTDGTFIEFAWFDTDDAQVSYAGTWLVVAPPGVSTVTMPAIPTTSAWPPLSDAEFNAPTVAMVEGDMIPSYAALRQFGLAFPAASFAQDSFDFGAIVPPLPSNGTVKVTAYVQIPE